MRAKVHVEDIRKDREALIVTAIPYQINKRVLIEKIAELVREKRVEGIADLWDETNREGMKWGTRYGAEYANRLYRACRRRMTGEMRFVCFTDDTSGLLPGIDARPLPAFENVPAHLAFTPWRKISLWQADM